MSGALYISFAECMNKSFRKSHILNNLNNLEWWSVEGLGSSLEAKNHCHVSVSEIKRRPWSVAHGAPELCTRNLAGPISVET